jgi:hypothetical protein
MAIYMNNHHAVDFAQATDVAFQTQAYVSSPPRFKIGWQHSAENNDGKTAQLFVDGVRVASNTNPVNGTSSNSNPLIVGAYLKSGEKRYGDGKIDDARIYSRAPLRRRCRSDLAA